MIIPSVHDSPEFMEFDDFSKDSRHRYSTVTPNIDLSRSLITRIKPNVQRFEILTPRVSELCLWRRYWRKVLLCLAEWILEWYWRAWYKPQQQSTGATFCFSQTPLGAEDDAALSEKVERFQIVAFEDHSRRAAGTTQAIVATFTLWEQKHQTENQSGRQPRHQSQVTHNHISPIGSDKS